MNESANRIGPARLEEVSEAIADVTAELSAAGAVLGSALHSTTAANLASLVCIVNTYYSNLIEGHDTRPRDIERALAGNFDQNEERRNLQLEAAAHVRVSRLMSHAMALKAGIGAQGLWSVSRGLARGLESRGDYKRMMDYADSPRQDDLDGRGNLSQRALAECTLWFLRVCLDQVNFMSGLFDLGNLGRRLQIYVDRNDHLKPETAKLLQEALIRGQFERGEAPRITGLPERSARRVLNDAITEGLLASITPKAPVSVRFPTAALETLFPRLYPEA